MQRTSTTYYIAWHQTDRVLKLNNMKEKELNNLLRNKA
ncbi:MAG: hypothetical protein IKS36_03795 [Bacteroidales bacterium]|nr:hypothetical protein [Bacteroidales bacterium]